jgi:glycosyltransferase involved in cell wall biosynthesis
MKVMYNGISIILCTYNGSKTIAESLSHINAIKFQYPFELIIVDNASTDDTLKLAHSILTTSKLNWKIVAEPNPGLSHARWKGILTAKYDIILFCDDDNYLAHDYLEVGFEIFVSNSRVGILGGKGIALLDGDKPYWFDSFSHSYAVGSIGKTDGVQKRMSYHYGAACFFLRSALLHLNKIGFVSVLTDRKGEMLSSGGDVELCYAVQLLNYDLCYSSDLHFKHFIEKSRLNRDYYLRLKKGITSSFPLLTAYEFFNVKSTFQYKKYLFKVFFESTIVLFFIFLRKIFFMQRKDDDIDFVIYKTRFVSFLQNYKMAVKHFLFIRTTIS